MQRYRQRTPKEENTEVTDNSQNEQLCLRNEVKSSFSTLVGEQKESKTINLIKDRLKDTFHTLTAEVEECGEQDIEAIKHLEKQITAVRVTFQSLRKYKPEYKLQAKRIVPHNKNIDVQKNFHSTKKKRKQKSNIRFAKPSIEERLTLFNKWKENENKKDAGNPMEEVKSEKNMLCENNEPVSNMAFGKSKLLYLCL